jgi:hypothetical protein
MAESSKREFTEAESDSVQIPGCLPSGVDLCLGIWDTVRDTVRDTGSGACFFISSQQQAAIVTILLDRHLNRPEDWAP